MNDFIDDHLIVMNGNESQLRGTNDIIDNQKKSMGIWIQPKTRSFRKLLRELYLSCGITQLFKR